MIIFVKSVIFIPKILQKISNDPHQLNVEKWNFDTLILVYQLNYKLVKATSDNMSAKEIKDYSIKCPRPHI